MGLLSSNDNVEKVTKSKEYTEHTGVVVWMDGEQKEYKFDGMKRKDGSIILKDYCENREGKMALQAWLTLPEANIREFKTVEREAKKIEWEEEKQEEQHGRGPQCKMCGKHFDTERGLEIHKAQKDHHHL